MRRSLAPALLLAAGGFLVARPASAVDAGVLWQPLCADCGPARRAHALISHDPSGGAFVVLTGTADAGSGAINPEVSFGDVWTVTNSGAWTLLPQDNISTAGMFYGLAGASCAGASPALVFGGYVDSPSVMTLPNSITWALRLDGGWSVLTDAGPASRFGASLAFDPDRGTAVLFGGASANPPTGTGFELGDTWEWNSNNSGKRWIQRSASNGAPRVHAAMAWLHYDGGSGTYLYGGEKAGACMPDLFAWDADAGTWSPVKSLSTETPGARCGASMVGSYGNLILFGGLFDGGMVNDTWAFNVLTARWFLLAPSTPSPAPRRYASFAWDQDAGYGLLFGGRVQAGASEAYANDAWQFHLSGSALIGVAAPDGGSLDAGSGSPSARLGCACGSCSPGAVWMFLGAAAVVVVVRGRSTGTRPARRRPPTAGAAPAAPASAAPRSRTGRTPARRSRPAS